MKLARFVTFSHQDGYHEKVGAVVGEKIIDLAAMLEVSDSPHAQPIPSSMRAFLTAGESAMASARHAIEFAHDKPLLAETRELASSELLAPVGNPQKIICVGQNYRDHCAE